MKLNFFKKLFVYIFILELISASSVLASSCRVAEGRLNFGKYDNFASNMNAKTVGELTIVCSNMTGDINYSLALTNNKLSIGNGKGGLLYYNLYTSANYTALWNETNLITGTVKNINGSGIDVKAIYGEVILTNKNNMTAGEYTSHSNPPMVKLIY
ncbi:MAG: spore coat protein U domain-containing protein [Pelagibacteraceae bacterium]|jgi:spore coat protein U-like protein